MDVPGFPLITGAAFGIEKAYANAFANEGVAGIVLLDINEEALPAVKAEIEVQQAITG
jgi:NADP-dependent 3-hydroxy acid dehydrogenase YdfG